MRKYKRFLFIPFYFLCILSFISWNSESFYIRKIKKEPKKNIHYKEHISFCYSREEYSKVLMLLDKYKDNVDKDFEIEMKVKSLIKLEEYDRALSALNKEPDSTDRYYELGRVYSKKGWYNKAIENFEKAFGNKIPADYALRRVALPDYDMYVPDYWIETDTYNEQFQRGRIYLNVKSMKFASIFGNRFDIESQSFDMGFGGESTLKTFAGKMRTYELNKDEDFRAGDIYAVKKSYIINNSFRNVFYLRESFTREDPVFCAWFICENKSRQIKKIVVMVFPTFSFSIKRSIDIAGILIIRAYNHSSNFPHLQSELETFLNRLYKVNISVPQ